MRNLFELYQSHTSFVTLLLWHLTKFISYRFKWLSSKKRAPIGCSFYASATCLKVNGPQAKAGKPSPQQFGTAGQPPVLGGRRVRLWRSVETGEGAPSVRKNIYLYYLSCRISRVLENWRSEFPNFLHAAPYWNSKDTLLPRFAKILLCVDL